MKKVIIIFTLLIIILGLFALYTKKFIPSITTQELEQGWYYGEYNQKKSGTPKDWEHSGSGTRSAQWHKPDLNENECASIGEKPTNNLDLRTGKTDPNVKPLTCCKDLKAIQANLPDRNSSNNNVCAQVQGVYNNVCSPCGNGTCDSQYEDYCNCPEDCK